MKELLRTGDMVRLSYLQALLAEAGIACIVLDENAGALLPSGILPRLMVTEDLFEDAQRLLAAAGEASGD